ncbi:hypothetical protein GCM10009745_78850 [Kribbella yunnanensis]|uniref:NACHT domain-containing protein n=1 Tax=Kribbella yunnanensis TaxID=190194 RepID=A0ABP4V7Y2_9ACTN
MAVGPPAVLSGWLSEKIRDNVLLSILVLIFYWIFVGVVRVLLRLGREVTDLWIPRAAAAVDRRFSAIVNSYRSRYLDQLLASVRDIELLGMTTQGEFSLRLRQVYVDVSLASSPSTAHAPFVGREIQGGERRSLDSFLSTKEPSVYAIIGGPGSGKTTLLRRTAMMLGERRRGRRSLPLLLYLRDHVQEIVSNPGVTVPQLLADVTWLKGMVTADWFERCLERGRCVVMLDGLDEVAVEDHRQLTSQWVRQQVTRYPENHFILTSRPYGYHANPVSGADILQVRRFTSDQIFKFVHAWYLAIESRSRDTDDEHTRDIATASADDLLRRMRSQPALYDLAANPMLLTMIANVHKYRGALPGSRAALYGEMCDLLLHRRQEAKNIQLGTGLKTEQRAKVVRQLAMAMMSREVRDIRLSTASELIGPSLARIPRGPQPDEFLDALTKSGLFIEREVGTYAFAHQTLQEYLAATEIRDHLDGTTLPAVVDNAWWRETILLWAADADASPVVAACLASGSVDALALAYDCAEEAREVDGELRQRLDALLYAEPPDNEATARAAHRQLMAAVRTSRSLRYTVTLSNDAVACANPMPQSLYRLYAELSGDPSVDASRTGQPNTHDDAVAAVGVPAAQVEKVVAWINSLFDDGTAYRLPTRRELADPMTEVVVDLQRYTIWYADPAPGDDPSGTGEPAAVPATTNGYTGPHLFVPRSIPHPFVASPDRLEDGIRRDVASVAGVLPFVLSLSLERNPDRARARDFGTTIRRIQRLEGSVSPALVKKPTHVDRALARSTGGYMEMGSVNWRADRMLVLARDLTAVKHLSIATNFVQNLRLAVGQDPSFERALGQALDIVLSHSLQTDELSLLVRNLKAPNRLASSDNGGETIIAWPEAAASPDTFELTAVGLTLLLSVWEPSRAKGRQRQTTNHFDTFLAGLCSPSAEVTPTIPEQITRTLHEVQSLLPTAAWRSSDATAPYGPGADPGTDEESWRFLARRVTALIAGLLDTAPHNPSDSTPMNSAIRLGLLAVIGVADKFTDSQIAAKTRGIHSSLTSVDARRSDPTLASEVILLVRT